MNTFGILIASAILSNIVLSTFAGIETSLDSAKNRKSLLAIGLLTIVTTVVSTLIASLLNTYVLKEMNLGSMFLLVDVVVISLVAYIITKIYKGVKKESELDSASLLSALITNNMVLFVVLQNATSANLANVVVKSLGFSAGFFLISFIMMTMELRLQSAKVMPSFKGKPVMLILMGVLSLIMIGLGGIV